MSKDPFFKCIEEKDSLIYEPEENFASMPHINPETYIAPGLMDDDLDADFMNAFDISPQRAPIGRRHSVLK